MTKYRAKKVTTADGTFDSKAELAHWGELKWRERAGEISHLKRQVKYSINVEGEHICDYYADFVYYDKATLQTLTIDVKGYKTDAYRLKAKLMKAVYGITILEVAAKRRR